MVSSRSLTAFLALASCFFCSAAFPSPACRRLAGFAVDIVDGGSRLPQPRSAGWTGQGEMYGHECAYAVRKTPPASPLSPPKRLEGSSGGLQRDKGEVPVVSDFSRRAPGGENARRLRWAEPHLQHQRRRCRQKSPHIVIYPCVLHFVQYGYHGKGCTGFRTSN